MRKFNICLIGIFEEENKENIDNKDIKMENCLNW